MIVNRPFSIHKPRIQTHVKPFIYERFDAEVDCEAYKTTIVKGEELNQQHLTKRANATICPRTSKLRNYIPSPFFPRPTLSLYKIHPNRMTYIKLLRTNTAS